MEKLLNNNRAFIKRDTKTTKHLEKLIERYDVVLKNDDQDYWYYESGESFHVHADEEKVIFQDSRIPKFTLDLEYVELEH